MNKPTWLPDTQGFLAIAIITIMTMVILILLLHPVNMSDTAQGVLMTVIGVLTGALKDVYSFFFGSSKGSSLKDETIKAAVEATPALKVQ